jgi:hypothetical protein
LQARSTAAAQGGKTQRYNIITHFDGTAQHPEFLTQVS